MFHFYFFCTSYASYTAHSDTYPDAFQLAPMTSHVGCPQDCTVDTFQLQCNTVGLA